MDTVAKFIWLPIESVIQAYVVELHIFSSSQENEFSNSIHYYSRPIPIPTSCSCHGQTPK